MRISFTGPRPKGLIGQNKMEGPKLNQLMEILCIELERLIKEESADTFVSGGALGFDTAAFLCVHKMKQKYPHVQNILAIPYKDQDALWIELWEDAKQKGWKGAARDWEETIKRYRAMIRSADKVVYVDEIPKYQPRNMKPEDIGRHANAKLQLRNIYMLDESDRLISAYDGGEKGGTYNCYKVARTRKMPTINFNPQKNFERTVLDSDHPSC